MSETTRSPRRDRAHRKPDHTDHTPSSDGFVVIETTDDNQTKEQEYPDMSANYDATAGSESTKSRSGRSFGEQSSRVAEEATELGRVALANAGEAATTLREKGRNALEAGREKARMAKDRMDTVVSENPMKSVLIALGVGILVGYVINRKSN